MEYLHFSNSLQRLWSNTNSHVDMDCMCSYSPTVTQ